MMKRLVTLCNMRFWVFLTQVALLPFSALVPATSTASAASAEIKFYGVVKGKPRGRGDMLEPLTAQAVSFTDKGALKLKSTNYGNGAVSVRFTAYDAQDRQLAANALPAAMQLAPGSAAMSTIIVPLSNEQVSAIRICSEHRTLGGSVTARKCGSYQIRRIALSE